MKWILIILLSFCFLLAKAGKDTIEVSEYLKIVPLTKNAYLHISYIPHEDGPIQCNGLVYFQGDEAAVFDTPVGDEASVNLLTWIYEEKQAKVSYLIVNHFHEDCLSELTTFVGTGCSTISQKKTCQLAGLQGYNCTQRYFKDSMDVYLGGSKIECRFLGQAHSPDNIVCYIPSERLLFGGCMVKSIGSDKGNMGHANLTEWPKTIERVISNYPKPKIVIPGHGDPGNKKLLAYTLQLFSL